MTKPLIKDSEQSPMSKIEKINGRQIPLGTDFLEDISSHKDFNLLERIFINVLYFGSNAFKQQLKTYNKKNPYFHKLLFLSSFKVVMELS